ncbi:MAG: aspartate/glutamate racemase family protein [Aquabacterium sp.]|nr:aspartate/glutamate racemase family protein [Aquabacterium sp.]
MKRIRLGMLTPSSNTALEPLCAAMLAGLPEVSVHFARFRVTQISLAQQALGQFELQPILQAAQLLADARVDVIAWNGTAAGWLGFDRDAALCEAITRETGIPACTSVLALNTLMDRNDQRRFGLVTPYTADVQQRIVDNYAASGYACVAERHLSLSVNFEFAEVAPTLLHQMAHEVAAAGAQCITTFCTNLHAAQLATQLEAELGIPLYDTTATAVWQCLRLTGVDTARVRGWGQLFQENT